MSIVVGLSACYSCIALGGKGNIYASDRVPLSACYSCIALGGKSNIYASDRVPLSLLEGRGLSAKCGLPL